MTRRWPRLPPLVLLAAVLLAPAPASALVGRFTFPATHGYKATLTAYGFGANLRLTRARGTKPKRASWVNYVARAGGAADHIDARFGDLGQLHMRFAPNGTVTHSSSQSGCRGADDYTFRHGNLVGSFRFEGEGAYATIDAHRGSGTTVSPSGPLHCTSSEGAGQGGGATRKGKLTSFAAGWHLRLRAESFSAKRVGVGPTRFEANEDESSQGQAIFRRVLLRASPNDFVTDGALSFATVTPPAPFAGAGYLRREASGRRTWTGPLSVSFPGRPDVTLTGPPFKTLLTRNW